MRPSAPHASFVIHMLHWCQRVGGVWGLPAGVGEWFPGSLLLPVQPVQPVLALAEGTGRSRTLAAACFCLLRPDPAESAAGGRGSKAEQATSHCGHRLWSFLPGKPCMATTDPPLQRVEKHQWSRGSTIFKFHLYWRLRNYIQSRCLQPHSVGLIGVFSSGFNSTETGCGETTSCKASGRLEESDWCAIAGFCLI